MSNIQTIKFNPESKVKEINIGQFLKQKEAQIRAVLPKHLTPDRMMRIAVSELTKTPKLKECTLSSLFGAIIQCSQLGLEPGGTMGHAYLIPFSKSKKNSSGVWEEGKIECQFILGYRGMIDLARRSGQIVSISAQSIYANDLFEFEYGLEEKLKHVPSRLDRGAFIGAYAIAKLKGGGYQMQVMFKNDIDRIRATSKSSGKGPWADHYSEMARKTVIRNLFKYLPISIEMMRAIELDDACDIGNQNNAQIIDGEDAYEIEHEKVETKSSKLAKTLAYKNNEMLATAQIEDEEPEKIESGITIEDPGVAEWAKDYDSQT